MHGFRSFRRVPRGGALEVALIGGVVVFSFAALALLGLTAPVPETGFSVARVALLFGGFFLASLVITVVAVPAGIGGGVLLTPLLLAFTPIDSLVVRATGLLVAMFSGLIATGPFLRKGLGNLKTCLFLNLAQSLGAWGGALGAIYVWAHFGAAGEGWVRLALGLLVALVAAYFVLGRNNLEWPEVRQPDAFTRRLKLAALSYYEPSRGGPVHYRLTRAGPAFAALLVVGTVGGFFGMGAGWAIVPIQNLVLGAPLKVAAANSGIILGMGSSVAVWPYLHTGALIPLFAAPWLAGQYLGGLLGSRILLRARAGFIRRLLIGILFFTSFVLVCKGLELLGAIRAVPGWITLSVLAATLVGILGSVLRRPDGSGEGACR